MYILVHRYTILYPVTVFYVTAAVLITYSRPYVVRRADAETTVIIIIVCVYTGQVVIL